MWPAIAALGGAYLGYKGTKDTNIASAQQAQNQMDFQERMSNTAIQRRMADLKAGGLNPILAGKFDASSPAGQQAPVQNKAQIAMQNAFSAANIANITAQTAKTKAETINIDAQNPEKGWWGDVKKDFFNLLTDDGKSMFDPSLYPMTSSALDAVREKSGGVIAKLGKDKTPFKNSDATRMTDAQIKKYLQLTYPEKFPGRR
jgi:hypothetical protein